MPETIVPSDPEVVDLSQLARELAELDPKPVEYFKPDNKKELEEAYLRGDTDSFRNATYSKLDSLDFDSREKQYSQLLENILARPDIPENHAHIYKSYIDRCIETNLLMQSAVQLRTAESEEVRQHASERFKELNEKLYGKPDQIIAISMVQEVLADSAAIIDPKLVAIRQEFIDRLPDDLKNPEEQPAILKPSQETREFVKNFAEYINAPLLKRADKLLALANENNLPEDEVKVSPTGIAYIFQAIINEEFPDSGWLVVIEAADSIKVIASEKKIVIPEERVPASPETVRGLVVHELGVHFLRSVMGEGSDLIPQRYGFAGYGDAEEGFATVMESSIKEQSSRTGYQHYLIATLFDKGYSFHEVAETIWRYQVIDEKIKKPTKVIDEDFLMKKKIVGMRTAFRSIRGTNNLAWHKTLSYFNGSHKIWKYIDENKDNPDMMMLLYLGKLDPTNPDHVRGALDAKTATTYSTP